MQGYHFELFMQNAANPGLLFCGRCNYVGARGSQHKGCGTFNRLHLVRALRTLLRRAASASYCLRLHYTQTEPFVGAMGSADAEDHRRDALSRARLALPLPRQLEPGPGEARCNRCDACGPATQPATQCRLTVGYAKALALGFVAKEFRGKEHENRRWVCGGTYGATRNKKVKTKQPRANRAEEREGTRKR
jgi:hypothetical protein